MSSVGGFYENNITRFRIPRRLISDNGTPFVNKNVRSLLEKYCIKHKRSIPYYPQGNGAKTINRVILKILRKTKHEYGASVADGCTFGM